MSGELLERRRLEDVLEELPPGSMKPEAKNRLRQVFKNMEDLPRVDEKSGQAYLHEPTLRKILRENLPAGIEDRFITGLKEFPDSKLTKKKMKQIPWLALDSYLDRGPPGETLEGMGLTLSSSPAEVRKAVQQRDPDIPDDLFNPDKLGRMSRELVTTLAAEEGQSVATAEGLPDAWDRYWSCFKARVGYWVATGLFLFVLQLVAILSAGGPLTWPAALAAAEGAGILIVALLLFQLFACLLQVIFG